MGKKFMKMPTILVWFLVLAVVAVVGGILYIGSGHQFSLGTGTSEEKTVKISGDASALCSLSPTFSITAVDAYNKGTAAAIGKAYSINGAAYTYTAPSSYAVGSKVKVMANASGYLNTVFDLGTVPCGAKPVELEMPAYTAPTLAIYDDAYNKLSDSLVGAVNGTKTASGGQTVLMVKVTGNNQKTSGNLVYVVETSQTANISESGIKMYDSNGVALKSVAVPTFYTATLTSPRMVAFEIPEIVGAASKTYSLALTASTGKVVQGAVYTTAYVEQAFIDTNGQTSFGVQNADGTDKSYANFDYDVMLK